MIFHDPHSDPYPGSEEDTDFAAYTPLESGPEPGQDAVEPFPSEALPGADPSGDDIANWHEQQAADTCAVVGQEFLIDRFTGIDHTEAELVSVAEAHDWYRPGGGTPMEDVGNLLEFYGVPVERTQGASLDNLTTALDEGAGVLVAVDSGELAQPDPDTLQLADAAGIPDQGADHVVQVIGVDRTDPLNPTVILNDPGRPDGAGLAVPERTFLDAWDDSGRFTVTAGRGGHE